MERLQIVRMIVRVFSRPVLSDGGDEGSQVSPSPPLPPRKLRKVSAQPHPDISAVPDLDPARQAPSSWSKAGRSRGLLTRERVFWRSNDLLQSGSRSTRPAKQPGRASKSQRGGGAKDGGGGKRRRPKRVGGLQPPPPPSSRCPQEAGSQRSRGVRISLEEGSSEPRARPEEFAAKSRRGRSG